MISEFVYVIFIVSLLDYFLDVQYAIVMNHSKYQFAKKYVYIITIITGFCLDLFPHPHVFVDSSFVLHFDKEGFSGFQVRWVFDEIFSSMIIADYDGNRNKIMEPKEISAVKDGAFKNLINFNYFTFIKFKNQKQIIKTVDNFTAEIIKDKIIYSFFVPVKMAARKSFHEVKLGSFDETYYCDIVYAESNLVTIKSDPDIESKYEIVDETDSAYWGGQIIPKVILLKFKKQN